MDARPGTDQPLRFGSFELDVRSRELRKGSRAIRLQEQPFEILRMMLERPGLVVTREELRQRLWPDGTFVDFEHSLNAAVKRLRAALGDDADNPRFVETLPRRGYRFIASLEEPESDRAGAISATPRLRLAVLPFTNLSQDSPEYFADGLTEEMIAQLGQLYRGRIGVIARWSSMLFKGTTQRAREIGQALQADYLLEGGVRREADRVRITARLVEASGETNLWAETYERSLTDCLEVQAEVAERIAQSLAVELVPEEDSTRMSTPTSASAYQEYLRGRYHWNRPDEHGGVAAGDVAQALAAFTEALRIDPRFAPAHAMVARVHVMRAEHYVEPARESLELARAAAERALELQPNLFEAHLAMGDVRRLHFDWDGADEAYTTALRLNPSQENVHRRYALMLASLSRAAEAMREADRAMELDPLCLTVGTNAAWVRYLFGDCKAALERCRRTLDLDPDYLPAQRVLAAAYLQAGRARDAIDALEISHPSAGQDVVLLAWLAHARAVTGDSVGSDEVMDVLARLGASRPMPQYHLALAHVGRGEVDEAFAALERAEGERDPALGAVSVEPRFQPLREDPRYRRLIARLGLPARRR